ncbi:MAG TPA: hypothetical protein VFM23_02415 [Gemmatimonadales bacterium]|jgi:hypothetical protein|nr:hypothetical protein [Gemmatimonadales bacterium]
MTRAERRSRSRPAQQQPMSERQRLEALMDKIIADTFPASDPPAWSSLCDRLNEID